MLHKPLTRTDTLTHGDIMSYGSTLIQEAFGVRFTGEELVRKAL